MSAERIVWAVRQEFDLDVTELFGSTRERRVAEARFIVFDLLRGEGYSLKKIGQLFGRNHTTVMSGLKRLEDLLATDKRYKARYEHIKRNIRIHEKEERKSR